MNFKRRSAWAGAVGLLGGYLCAHNVRIYGSTRRGYRCVSARLRGDQAKTEAPRKATCRVVQAVEIERVRADLVRAAVASRATPDEVVGALVSSAWPRSAKQASHCVAIVSFFLCWLLVRTESPQRHGTPPGHTILLPNTGKQLDCTREKRSDGTAPSL